MTLPIAVAVTVKDEERSIERLLDGLAAQTLPPAKILMTDCGSTDRTVELIQRAVDRGQPVRLQQDPRACRGRGRNLAIKAAEQDWVAVIDAGCVPEPQWLEALAEVALAAPGTDVIFGVVRPVTNTLFTQCASTAWLSATQLPDGRRVVTRSVASLLMRRSIWERVGGFPEGPRSGEDLLFIERIERAGYAAGLAPRAVVHWEIPTTLPETMKRFARYSQYTLEAGLGHRWHARALMYYAAALLLVILGVWRSWVWLGLLGALMAARILRTIMRNEKEQRGLRAFAPARVLLIGGILLAVDAATLYGAWRWLRELVVRRWLSHGAAHEPSPS